VLVHQLATIDRQHRQHEADHRYLADAPGAQVAQVHAHEQRHRNSRGDGEYAPRRVGERLDDDQRQHREDDDHDHEGAEQGDDPRHPTLFLLDKVAERATVAPRGDEQDDEVLHRAREHHAGKDPQQAWQITHLGRQHRPDQRTGPGDCGEVMAVQHVLVRRHIVEPVVVAPGRRLAPRVQFEDARGDEQAVVAVRDQVDADRCHDQPQRADGFTACQCDRRGQMRRERRRRARR